MEAYRIPVINKVLARVDFTVCPFGQQTHLLVSSSLLEGTIWINILSNCHNASIGSLTCGIRAITVGKAKWKPRNCIPTPTPNRKQSESKVILRSRIVGGMEDVSDIFKLLNDARVRALIKSR